MTLGSATKILIEGLVWCIALCVQLACASVVRCRTCYLDDLEQPTQTLGTCTDYLNMILSIDSLGTRMPVG